MCWDMCLKWKFNRLFITSCVSIRKRTAYKACNNFIKQVGMMRLLEMLHTIEPFISDVYKYVQ